MKTLFGIRSNVALAVVGLLYFIISLNTSVYVLSQVKESISERYSSKTYLLIDTNTRLFQVYCLVLSLSCLIASLLLILSGLDKRHGLLWPWLIVNIVLESLLTSFFFYLIFLLIQTFDSSWNDISGLLLAISVNALAIAFHDYLRNGSYALYKDLRKESRRLFPA